MRGRYLLAARVVLLIYVVILSVFGYQYWPVAWRFCNGSGTVGDILDTICTFIAVGGISASMLLLIAGIYGISKIADKCRKQV